MKKRNLKKILFKVPAGGGVDRRSLRGTSKSYRNVTMGPSR